MFRLSMQQAGGTVMPLPASSPSSSPSEAVRPSPTVQLPSTMPRPAPRSIDAETEEEQHDDADISNGMDILNVDEGGGAGIVTHILAGSLSPLSGAGASSVVVAPSSSQHDNIRRSARQQHRPDRLVYPASEPCHRSKETAASTTTRPRSTDKRVAKRRASHAEPGSSTDAESAAASSSSSGGASYEGTAQHEQQRRKKRQHDGHASTAVPCTDSGEEEQCHIAALVKTLQDAHSRRVLDLDLQSASKEAVLQLGRDILSDSTADVDARVYQRCAVKLDHLISTSSAMRMLGYYLRGALAFRLQRSHKSRYVHSARRLLGIKSSADIAACPAFYSCVQQHCPSVATGVMDVEAWLQEPVFLADIAWSEWRRLLGKPHRWIIDTAMEQFNAWRQPAQDWMQRGWVELYDDDRLGRGVRVVCDLPLPTSNERSDAAPALTGRVAADLGLLARAAQQQQQHDERTAPWSCFEWDDGRQQLDAEQLWVGSITICRCRTVTSG